MIERFAAHLVRWRRWWTVGVLAAFAGLAWMSSRIELRDEIADFLPRGSREIDSTERLVRSISGGADRILVVVETSRPVATNDVPVVGRVVDSLAARLERTAGVRRVTYRLPRELRSYVETDGAAHLLVMFDSLQLKGLAHRVSAEEIRRAAADRTASGGNRSPFAAALAADPLGVLAPIGAVLQRAVGATRLRVTGGYLTLLDRKGFLLIVEPEAGLTDIQRARGLVAALGRRLEESERELGTDYPGSRIVAVGRPVGFVRAYETILADGAKVGLASLIATLVLLVLFFRRALAPLILIGTVFFGLALTGAIVSVTLSSVSLMAWMFVAVLVGLGDEFAFYIAAHYWLTGRSTDSRESALAAALRVPARGLWYSGLAMAAAFSTLALVSYPVTAQVAWITGLGLVAMMAASFVVLPVALAHTAPGGGTASVWAPLMAFIHRLGERQPRASLVAWVLLIGIGFASVRRIPFEPHPWKIALRGNPSTAEMERVRQALGFWPSPIMMVSTGATLDEALERDRRAVAGMESIGSAAGVVAIESLAHWLPPAEQQRASIAYVRAHPDAFSGERFRRDVEATLGGAGNPAAGFSPQYVAAVSRVLTPEPREITVDTLRRFGLESLLGRHLVRAGDRYLAISNLYLERFPWAEGVVSRFDGMIRKGGASFDGARFIGDALRGATHADRLRRDILRATTLGLVLVGGLLWFQFRRAVPALLCLVPLIAGIAAALGTMALLRIELNVLTLTVAPLLVGLCVDDGIHMMERLEQGESSLTVLHDNGAAMIITTATTIAGFACLGFATFRGMFELGLVASVGITVALGASLHLLPVIHRVLRDRGKVGLSLSNGRTGVSEIL